MRESPTNTYTPTFRVNHSNCRKNNELLVLHPPQTTTKELFEIFPEAKEIIPKKLKDWQEREKEIRDVIKYNLRVIKNKVNDEDSCKIWRELAKLVVADELLEIERHIQQLERLNLILQGKISNSKILSEEKVEQARKSSIVEVARLSLELRKSGKNYLALCPFHQEKHPSFYIYPDTNSFYCFGCHQGGDVIKFVELAFNYSFKEAVEYLTRR